MEQTKNNSFHFNLIQFFSGGARRLPPLRSVFTLLFCICFCLFSSPLSAFATAPILHPEIQPIIDTDIVSLQEQYLNLSPVAQAAGSILFGAYVTEYAGLADYGTVFDSMPTDGSVWDRLQFVGQQAFDTILLPFNMANQLVVRPIYNICAGICNSVKDVESLSDFTDDIMNSDKYTLPYSPALGDSLNQLFAHNGGLNQWQFSNTQYSPEMLNGFNWRTASMNGSQQITYNNYLENISLPVRTNWNISGYYNFISDFTPVQQYCYVFADTTNNAVYLCNSLGDRPDTNIYFSGGKCVYTGSGGGPVYELNRFGGVHYNVLTLSDFSSIDDLFNYLNTHPQALISTTGVQHSFNIADFVLGFYIGDSWQHRSVWSVDSDLGFVPSSNLQYLNPKKDVLFDLKGLVNDIVAYPGQVNETIPLKDIALQNTYLDNELITAEQLQPTSLNVTPPVSGVEIPEGLFSGLVNTGGFVSYLWYMTKPLVSFTGDLIDALTFDGFDGADPVTGATVHFSGSGPGQIFIGVVCVGLIGGLVVKCLL